jgi:hypothetical protein
MLWLLVLVKAATRNKAMDEAGAEGEEEMEQGSMKWWG